jgi:hypothetical protein
MQMSYEMYLKTYRFLGVWQLVHKVENITICELIV